MWANKMGKIKENDSKCRYQQPCMAVSQVVFRCAADAAMLDTG